MNQCRAMMSHEQQQAGSVESRWQLLAVVAMLGLWGRIDMTLSCARVAKMLPREAGGRRSQHKLARIVYPGDPNSTM